MPYLVVGFVALLVGCGHVMRAGVGPTVDDAGRAGAVGSFEIATHLLSAKEIALPIGLRAEVGANSGGVHALVGLSYALSLPPGGRKNTEWADDDRAGLGGRAAAAFGPAFGRSESLAFGMRGALSLTHGSLRRAENISSGGCSGGHEKMSTCYSWRAWSYRAIGVEIGNTMRFTGGDDPDDGSLSLVGWRASAELVFERGVLEDLSFH